MRRKLARCDIERSRSNCWRTTAGSAQRAQPVDAGEQFLVDFELGLIRDVDLRASKVTLAIVEWPERDRVGHFIFTHADQRATDPDVLLIDRRYFREDKLFRYRFGGCWRDVDRMRCCQVEIELEQGGPSFCDEQTVAVRQVDPEFSLSQDITVQVLDHGLLRFVGRFNEYLGIRVVETNRP